VIFHTKEEKGKISLFSTENDLKIEEGTKYFNAEIFPNIFSSLLFVCLPACHTYYTQLTGLKL
jgi:hypothetical protein